jgi:shikimate kinase
MIEKKLNLSINAIFEKHGEIYFSQNRTMVFCRFDAINRGNDHRFGGGTPYIPIIMNF